MSTITLTDDERTRRVMALGYTEREALFLCLAALHGGFFLRRQFCQFIASHSGGADAVLIEKLINTGHGIGVTGCQKATIYHISARPFYAALGQEDNRNRRMRPPVSIKNRLMALDYILDHPPHQYLATEQEKVYYFTHTLGLDPGDLPEKPFRSPKGEDSTIRFFVEKYPIFTRDQSEAVCFCFIDEGTVTLSRFESFLHQYRRLFSHLTQFEVIYVAASPASFWEAERLFRGFVSSQSNAIPATLRDLGLPRIFSYFQDRQLFEKRQFDSFDKPKLIQLRDDREAFFGTFFESLYRSWVAGGPDAVHAILARRVPPEDPLRGLLSTCLLRHTYDLFGTSTKSKCTEAGRPRAEK